MISKKGLSRKLILLAVTVPWLFFLCVRIRKYAKSNNKKIAERLLTAKIIGYQNKLIEVFAVNMLYYS